MNFLSKAIVTVGLGILSIFGYHVSQQSVVAGSFTPVQAGQATLSGAGINATQTTIPLNSFTTPDGRTISMTSFGSVGYATIEPNTNAKIEDISFTGITQNANGTAVLTGVTRGIDFIPPYGSNVTLAYAHAGGTYLVTSNSPVFYSQFAQLGNSGEFTSLQTFLDPPIFINAATSTSQAASVAYVNSVVAAGCANASESVKGCTQLATNLQAASSTSSGSTGARLVIPASMSTSTPGSIGLWNVMTLNDGNISPLFLDGSAENYTFSGQTTIATTTIYTENVGNIIATSTISTPSLSINGIAINPFGSRYTFGTTSPMTASGAGGFATSSPITLPINIATASSTIDIYATLKVVGDSTGGSADYYVDNVAGVPFFSTQSQGTSLNTAASTNVSVSVHIQILANNSTSAQKTADFSTVTQTLGTLNIADFTTQNATQASTINMSTLSQMFFVIHSSTHATITLTSLNFVVNP